MKSLAKQYKDKLGTDISNNELIGIARENLADLFSNNKCSWIEFCDGSILSTQCGGVKAYKKLMPFHRNGVAF